MKIEVGVTETDIDYVYGVFALDSNGNLYFGTDNDSLELIDTNVKDFHSSESSFYLLKENGDLMKPKGGCRWQDHPDHDFCTGSQESEGRRSGTEYRRYGNLFSQIGRAHV